MVFFNNNQVNSGAGSLQSLAAWGQIWITNSAGNLVANSVYDFSNSKGKYDLFTRGGGGTFMGDLTGYTSAGIGVPLAGNNASTDYVLSGGAICRNAGVPVLCSAPHDEQENHRNLGANNAAYAILVPELALQLNGLVWSAWPWSAWPARAAAPRRRRQSGSTDPGAKRPCPAMGTMAAFPRKAARCEKHCDSFSPASPPAAWCWASPRCSR